MQSAKVIVSTTIRANIFFAYVLGFLFGGGLHLHSSIHHEDETEGDHDHPISAHAHEADAHPSSGHEALSIPDHGHGVPLLRLVAIRPHSLPTVVIQPEQDPAGEGSAAITSQPSPILFIQPESSPPLRRLTTQSSSGRSPPTA